MATVTTVTPSVTTRPHIPGSPGDRSLAGEVDLATRESWSYVSSFIVGGLELAFNSGGPTVDIAQGRIARARPDADPSQELITVGAVSGVSLASSSTNYIYFKENNDIEVRDSDNPPSADALLVGTVDTGAGSVTEAVRGRSPISQFVSSQNQSGNGATLFQTGGTGQSISGGASVIQVNLNATDFDTIGTADPANSTVSAPDDGLFIVSAQVILDDPPDNTDINIRVTRNGSDVIFGQSQTGSTQTDDGPNAVRTLQLTAGDDLTLSVQQTSSNNLSIVGGAGLTYLSVAKV